SLSLFSIILTPPPATPTLSLHDALPISAAGRSRLRRGRRGARVAAASARGQTECRDRHQCSDLFHDLRLTAAESGLQVDVGPRRSEEHTSELQSPDHLVCRLLLEKKKEE